MRKISIGNDIVGLSDTNAERAGNQKFYSKFLNDSEVSLFYKNDFDISFVQYAWLCWSIKESVYKFQKRLQPNLLNGGWKINVLEINSPINPQPFTCYNVIESDFIPVRFCYSSVASINSIQYYSWSLITNEFIYTITTNKTESNNVYWGIKKIERAAAYNDQSKKVRAFMLQKLCKVTGIQKVEIKKTVSGIPYIDQYPQLLLSFTHHVFFIGYAFLKDSISIEANRITAYGM